MVFIICCTKQSYGERCHKRGGIKHYFHEYVAIVSSITYILLLIRLPHICEKYSGDHISQFTKANYFVLSFSQSNFHLLEFYILETY